VAGAVGGGSRDQTEMPHDVVLQAQVFGLGVEMDPLQGCLALAGLPQLPATVLSSTVCGVRAVHARTGHQK
jgi:hypothetical protein